MSNGCRFQTRSFPSRVPKGTRSFLMRRLAVYHSNKGIYFDDHLTSSTSTIKLTTNTTSRQCKHPTRKILGGLDKSKITITSYGHKQICKTHSGAAAKTNIKRHKTKTRSRRCSGAEGQKSKSQNNCIPYTPLGNTLGGWKHKQISYIQNPTRVCSGAPSYKTQS